MTLTETEAREKWCPMARVDGANRTSHCEELNGAMCIASRCMMWRWFDSPVRGAFREAEHGTPRPERRGFCGLAGRP